MKSYYGVSMDAMSPARLAADLQQERPNAVKITFCRRSRFKAHVHRRFLLSLAMCSGPCTTHLGCLLLAALGVAVVLVLHSMCK